MLETEGLRSGDDPVPPPVREDPGYGVGPVLDTENLLPAERKLLHAVRTSTICDPIPYESKLHNFEIAGRTFRTIRPSALEIAEWTSPERMIRGEILARLIRHGYSDGPVKNIELRGAIIAGTLYLSDEIVAPAIELSHCRIENISAFRTTFMQRVIFAGSVFPNGAMFHGASFAESAQFNEASFEEVAHYSGATFIKEADFIDASFSASAVFDDVTWFGRSKFAYASFSRDARFRRAVFKGSASFERASFIWSCKALLSEHWSTSFEDATFDDSVSFNAGSFLGDCVSFARASFTGEASFTGAIFDRLLPEEAESVMSVVFDNAAFAATVSFAGALFDHASFDYALFGGAIRFEQSTAAVLSLANANIHSEDLGIFAARSLVIDSATCHKRIRFTAMCESLSAKNTQFAAGGHLRLCGASTTLENADFLTRAVISDCSATEFGDTYFGRLPQVTRPVYALQEDDLLRRALEVRPLPEKEVQRRRKILAYEQHRERAGNPMAGLQDVKPSITDLRSANVKNLVLSSIDLRECRFIGAHELDTLRIDSSCDLLSSASLPGLTIGYRSIHTKRKIIAEELKYRMTGEGNALDLATTYRDLRRGVETSKNEPGAADFYYGEMEMRRRSPDTPCAERILLHLYWAVSGYGLRAMRAFLAVVLLILVCGAVFWLGGLAGQPDGAPHIGPFELALRNSIALLRNPGTQVNLTWFGTAADIAVRLLTPVILSLGLLALRARTKR